MKTFYLQKPFDKYFVLTHISKKKCFQRGFELIKNNLRRKCGTVTNCNQQKSLFKEIYKVKT